jgi:branched-chain amino acid transport system substrate-binding protein
MKRVFVSVAGILLVGSLASIPPAVAANGRVKLAVLNDMSGPGADYQGMGSVVAAQLAIEDYGGKVAGLPIELVSGDHLNQTDVGSAITRKWFAVEGVDAVLDVPNSSVALAINNLVRDNNKVFIASGAGTSALTGANCSPNTVAYTYDAWQISHGMGSALVKEGYKNWFFITTDYAFGLDVEKNAVEAIKKEGGSVLGQVRHPLNSSDFSSYLLTAQSSPADVVGFASVGEDLSNLIKQAKEFGLTEGKKMATFVLSLNGVDALGLAASKGLFAINTYYWDYNEGTRAFAKRYAERSPRHAMPNDTQAGVYAGVLHYLKAVEKLGSAQDGNAVVKMMKSMPTQDPIFGEGSIRADGRKLHPAYLLQVKSPEESKGKWDYFKVVRAIPGDEAFRPLSVGGCPILSQM